MVLPSGRRYRIAIRDPPSVPPIFVSPLILTEYMYPNEETSYFLARLTGPLTPEIARARGLQRYDMVDARCPSLTPIRVG